MRVCIISDLHANLSALAALPTEYDELWVLGDLVNYGPDPAAVIDFVRARAAVVIRGNHDNAVGLDVDCQCSPRFRQMAEATMRYTQSVLGADDKRYLRELPTFAWRELEGRRAFLCHATPADLLFEYRLPDSPLWAAREERSADAAVMLAGHTHLPFARTTGARLVANPGSVGQSKAGDARARYAIWEKGELELKAYEYPVETTVAKIGALPLPEEVKRDLATVLRTGKAP